MRNMRKSGNTAWRTEQYDLYKKLKLENPTHEILMEEPIPGGVPDIIDKTAKIIYRCQGDIHLGRLRRLKDEDQLEVYEKQGYVVKDEWFLK